ncbi:PREDICTED: rapid alkalinization factor 23-like [Tarenaya hassleriana]|uniref:rapid alkalinization factor 23-like n=1 Tax=Tarenaya hassleriana TaxID=28532 RepID=UPI00053C70A3|nr:PREDICTED: rapid alkalinization factor 23-like [Tarenaya hassleriana]
MGRLCGSSGPTAAAIFAVMAILSVQRSAASASVGGFTGDFFPIETKCLGSMAQCSISAGDGDLLYGGEISDASEEMEMEMESETSRRILATRRYISYGALRRGSVPCSRRGASYYNCRRGAQANPYSRGCSTITRCRR